MEAITQYQCGVDPSEDNSGTTSSDEDVQEAKEEKKAENVTTRDSTPSKTLTNKTLQQEFELLSLNLGSVKAEGLTAGKRSVKFTATVAANQVKSLEF